MNLKSQTVPVSELSAECVSQMCRLMQAHYEGVTEHQFTADLNAKQWVILLREREHLYGFSTQVVFDHDLDGETVTIVFSGDTIIDKNHWGSMALPVAWGRLMLSLLAAHPERDLYWLLTSKGYKTYRFLPVFFQEFYPCHSVEIPAYARKLIQLLGARHFGKRFDAAAGILRAESGAQRLREGIAELDDRRMRDPHIAFFQQQNPGHARGDELVCLARFHPTNLTPFIRRQL
jgi:hypothetical protein